VAAEIKSQCRKTPNLGEGNPHRKRPFHSGETHTTGHSGETPTTFDILGRGRGTEPDRAQTAEGCGGANARDCQAPLDTQISTSRRAAGARLGRARAVR
jgi:hypothetical protein